MAERRMFAKTIVMSDAFLDLPMSARCLYFSLGMVADDDGFVNNPKSVMRQVGASNDDLSLLLAKRYLLGFDSGVVAIKHWKIHNYIPKDRYKETKYFEEKATLTLDEKGAYTEKKGDVYTSVYNTYTECIQPRIHRLGKVSIGKDRLGKYSIVEGDSALDLTDEQIEELIEKLGEDNCKTYANRLNNFIKSKGAHVQDHYATIIKWYTEDKAKQSKGSFETDTFFAAAVARMMEVADV